MQAARLEQMLLERMLPRLEQERSEQTQPERDLPYEKRRQFFPEQARVAA